MRAAARARASTAPTRRRASTSCNPPVRHLDLPSTAPNRSQPPLHTSQRSTGPKGARELSRGCRPQQQQQRGAWRPRVGCARERRRAASSSAPQALLSNKLRAAARSPLPLPRSCAARSLAPWLALRLLAHAAAA
eukprot:1633257-Rhodomonas_salina.2